MERRNFLLNLILWLLAFISGFNFNKGIENKGLQMADSTLFNKEKPSTKKGQLSNPWINVTDFGAKGDGITDDTVSIQAAINYIREQSKNKLKGGMIVFPQGTYKISKKITIDTSYTQLKGLGSVIIKANSTFNDLYILEVGSSLTSDYVIIDNIKFEKSQSNPFNIDFDSDKYGAGRTYDFTTSNAGILMNDAHYYRIENCHFTGLRLGVLLLGAWSGAVNKCIFEFNNRHIQADSNRAGTRANNFICIEDSRFGTAILNGGLCLMNIASLNIINCNLENMRHSGIYLNKCTRVKMSQLHMESNAIDVDIKPKTAFHFQPTVFKTKEDDACPEVYDGFFVLLNACHGVNISDCSMGGHDYANNSLSEYYDTLFPLRGFILNVYCIDSIYVSHSRFDGMAPIAFCQNYDKTSSLFVFEDINCRPIWKLHNVKGSTVLDTLQTTSSDYYIPDTFYVDLEGGNDNTFQDKMSSTTRIKNLSQLWMCLPQNSKVTYKIIIKNDNPAKNIVLGSAPSGGGTIKLIGDGKTATDLKAVFLSPIINGYVYMENITAQYINQRFYDGAEDSVFACGILKLFNCQLNGSKIDGLLVGEYGSKFILENVTVTSKSPREYCMTVLNHQEVWINGGTFNKPVYVRDYGKVWYKNILKNPPIVESGYIGKVTQL